MKDIFTILAENNVTVPDEVKSAITAAVGENYKTVAEAEKSRERGSITCAPLLDIVKFLKYEK